jgi:hypothetical protein
MAIDAKKQSLHKLKIGWKNRKFSTKNEPCQREIQRGRLASNLLRWRARAGAHPQQDLAEFLGIGSSTLKDDANDFVRKTIRRNSDLCLVLD